MWIVLKFATLKDRRKQKNSNHPRLFSDSDILINF